MENENTFKSELQKLPALAVVAFATRCARRVQPLASPCANEVAVALAFAENISTGQIRNSAEFDAAVDAINSANAALEDFARGASNTPASRASVSAASAASDALNAAVTAYLANDAFKLSGYNLKFLNEANNGYAATTSAAETAVFSTILAATFSLSSKAPSPSATSAYSAFKMHLHNDLLRLHEQVRSNALKNDTPVLQEVFGPLWPEGAPNWLVD